MQMINTYYVLLFVLVITTPSSYCQFYSSIALDGILSPNEWPMIPQGTAGSAWSAALQSSSAKSLYVAAGWPTLSPATDALIIALEFNHNPSNTPTSATASCSTYSYSVPFKAPSYFCIHGNTVEYYVFGSGSYSQASTPNNFDWIANNSIGYRTIEMQIYYPGLDNQNVNNDGDNSVLFHGQAFTSLSTYQSGAKFHGFFLSTSYGFNCGLPNYYYTYPFAFTSTAGNWTDDQQWFGSYQAGMYDAFSSNAMLYGNSVGLYGNDRGVAHLVLMTATNVIIDQDLTLSVAGLYQIPSLFLAANGGSVGGLGTLEMTVPCYMASQNSTPIGFNFLAFKGDGTVNNTFISINVNGGLTINGVMQISNYLNYQAGSTLVCAIIGLIAYSKIYKKMNQRGKEWPLVYDTSIASNYPYNVFFDQCNGCILSISAGYTLANQANVFAYNSTVLFTGPLGLLTIAGDLNVTTDSYIYLNTTLLVHGKINLDSSYILCPDQPFLVEDKDGSFWPIEAITVCLEDGTCTLVHDKDTIYLTSLNDEEVVTAYINSTSFDNLFWLLGNESIWTDDGAQLNVSLDAGTTYTLVGVYSDSGCYSALNFTLQLQAPQGSSTTSSGGRTRVGLIVGVVIAGLVLIGAAAVAAFFIIKKRNNPSKESKQPKEKDLELSKAESKPTGVAVAPIDPSKRNSKLDRVDWEIPYTELEIGKELGRGAFGVVYKCRWRNTDCVVKQLDINKNDHQSIKQFLKEADNVKGLRPHTNVCSVYGICTDPDHPICIVMEYLPDGSLDTLVYKNKIGLDAEMILRFAMDIASGMSHIHHENVLHCDLACRNLLLTARGNNKYQVKIADFGLSRVTESETYNATTTTSFPVRWTAPETLQSGKIARASDIWSYGVVLWEIAEGKRPYTDMSNAEVIKAVCDQGVRLPRPERVEIPDELWQLMLSCWNQEPDQRPSFNDIYSELRRIENKYFPEEDAPSDNIRNNNEPETYNNMGQKEYTNSGQKEYNNNPQRPVPSDDHYN